jgi:hypothetical protein
MSITPANPRTYFDISIGGKPAGKIVFELFADVVPKTVRCSLNLFTCPSWLEALVGEAREMTLTLSYVLCVGGELPTAVYW